MVTDSLESPVEAGCDIVLPRLSAVHLEWPSWNLDGAMMLHSPVRSLAKVVQWLSKPGIRRYQEEQSLDRKRGRAEAEVPSA